MVPMPLNISKWFSLGIFNGWPKMLLKCSSGALFCSQGRHKQIAHGSSTNGGGIGRVGCDGNDEAIEQQTFLAIGITSASSAVGHKRRHASRHTWARAQHGVLTCFLLSSRGPAERQEALRREAKQQRDMLFFDVAESATLSADQARLAGFKKRVHGHCVFKNYAWVRHAATHWPRVPWVAKVDDDSLVNLPPTLDLLRSLGCHRHAFVGPMLWTSWLPALREVGIRSLPCGYSTGGLLGALQKLSQPITTLFDLHRRISNTPCDELGAVPPFPFALGGGYVFSSALLQRLASSPLVAQWVAAAEATQGHEGEPQVVFFSDTTMGYWLSLLTKDDAQKGGEEGMEEDAIAYVDIMPWAHDSCCPGPSQAKGSKARTCRQSNTRPPSPTSLLVHGLKRGGFLPVGPMEGRHRAATRSRGSLSTPHFHQLRCE